MPFENHSRLSASLSSLGESKELEMGMSLQGEAFAQLIHAAGNSPSLLSKGKQRATDSGEDEHDDPMSQSTNMLLKDDRIEPAQSSIHAIYKPFGQRQSTHDAQLLTRSIYDFRLDDAIDAANVSLPQEDQDDELQDDASDSNQSGSEEDFNDIDDTPPMAVPDSLTAEHLQALDVRSRSDRSAVQSRASSRSSASPEQVLRRVQPSKATQTERSDLLAQKLQKVFGLTDKEQVLAEYQASLFRSHLLQGYLYCTTGHICFYAYLRTQEGQAIRAGTLAKRSRRTRRFYKHHFILRDDALTWYPSISNPYFPDGDVSLQYVTAVVPSVKHPKAFKIFTATRCIYLSADSRASRDEWVKVVQKAIFRSQSKSDSIKLVLPFTTIKEIRKESLNFVDALCISTQDAENEGQAEDYFFCYFSSLDEAQDTLRRLWEGHIAAEGSQTAPLSGANSSPHDSHLARRASIDTITKSTRPLMSTNREFVYPPEGDFSHTGQESTGRSSPWPSIANLPGWLRSASGALLNTSLARAPSGFSTPKKSRLQESPSLTARAQQQPSQSLEPDPKAVFNLGPSDKILTQLAAYIHRTIPIFGQFYITTQHLCFQSTTLLAKTKMILPLRDITSSLRSRSLRPGYHGLVVVVKSFEEIFFEMSSESDRDTIKKLLDFQVDHIRRVLSEGRTPSAMETQKEANDMAQLFTAPAAQTPADPTSPGISPSASIVDFKPSQPLHFVCLTIGSRGDVQPYIALCQGLLKEGHRCKIASHPEYRDWVESYHIEFEGVGGDPAELMRICVEHGTFTLGFLREGLSKFRGWLDDLLTSSWEACRDADVLIESPSAMAGIHIAEALRIPYFRAFTMPWSRTRAYSHAFAVPENKLGGQYNQYSYIMFDNVFWHAIAGQVNAWRASTLSLPSTNLDRLEQGKVPFLYNLSPALMPRPLDWPEWIHVTGYWFLDNSKASQLFTPPTDLLAFITRARDAHRRIIYVGFGSIVVKHPNRLTQTIFEAIDKSGVCAIVSKGWSNRLRARRDSSLSDDDQDIMPTHQQDSIYLIDSVPHDWLFPLIDACCHHGGSGTTGASLKAGIPTIISAFFGDQYFQADRVEALGVGIRLREMTVASLARAISIATTDSQMILQARSIGEAISRENGVMKAIDTLYRDMDYASSLIKNVPNPAESPIMVAARSRSRSVSGEQSSTETASSWDQVSVANDNLARSGISSPLSDTPIYLDQE